MEIFRGDNTNNIHRGAIYSFRPFFWLETPLWIARVDNYSQHDRHARIYTEDQLTDAFRGEHIEEDILVKAKRRFLIIISHNNEAQASKFHDVLVAPFYSFDGKDDIPRRRESAINIPSLFYIDHDINYPEMREGVVNLRAISLLKKDFLPSIHKLPFSLTADAMKAILKRYIDYLSSR